jgi:hypothetical protein
MRDNGGEPITFHTTPASGLDPVGAADPARWGKLKLLLDRGADINATAPDGGNLALYLTGDWDQVAYLIERGADFLHKDDGGGNVATEVQRRWAKTDDPGLEKVKRLLIERGVHFPVALPPPIVIRRKQQ